MTVKSALRDLNNAVLDLQSADYNTFEWPLERMAAALRSDALKAVTDDLKSKADLDAFLSQADEGGSMMGSARLIWPASREEHFGLVIQIIERGAEKPDWFSGLAHHYYYSGSKIVAGIRKITSAVIIPFNRDFATYVEEQAPAAQPQLSGTSMTVQQDKEELLQRLYQMGQATGKRPSVGEAGMKYFPDWEQDRLLHAAQALLDEGAILNPTSAILYVDLSSTGRKRAEQRAGSSSTGVTYNIGTMNQSPLQHISAGGHGTQNIQYAPSDLRAVVELYRANIDALGLAEAQRRKADASIATIEAQLIDEPDPTIVQAAGRSLKTIIEGAIGGAAGNAIAAAPVWAPLLSMFG